MLDHLAGLGPMEIVLGFAAVGVFLLAITLKAAAWLGLLFLPFFLVALRLQKALRPSKVAHRAGN